MADQILNLVLAPQFVINITHEMGGNRNSGFTIIAGISTTLPPGGGLEYDQDERDKLAAIEAEATIDQTGGEIKTLYELEGNTNAYTDAEKSKLASITPGATDDLTGAEIKVLYELENDTNAFTDLEQAKLGDIEADATVDQTPAEIRTAVEAASDSNVFTDADHSKLNAIEAGATTDQTDAQIRTAVEAASDSNVFTDADHSKLGAIEASATVDQTDSEIETAYNAQVAKISAGEITAGTEATVRRVSPADLKAIVLAHETGAGGGDPNPDQVSAQEIIDGTEPNLRSFSPNDIEAMAALHGGGGGGDFVPLAPSRSTLTVSGADSAIAIPDGCTWFKYDTGFLVAGGTSDAPYAGVRYGGTPTDQLFSGIESLTDTALSLSTVTANGAVAVTAADGGGTARSMSGIVWAPRDGNKKTMAHGYGIAHGTPKSRERDLVADAAEDDDTFFISGNAGTVTGSVEIEWFYDGGAMTDAAIRAAVEAATDSNIFTDADHSKLDAISADTDFYDLGMDFVGVPEDAQVIARWVVLREITMAADFAGAAGDILVNPAATLAIDIKDDGTTIGTVSISTSGVFTFTTVSGTAKVVAAGSIVTATAPGTADTTGSDIVFTLPGAL